MLEIPRRQSLAAQAVSALREGIQSGVWRDHLPGERVLCDRLQIGRTTLRAALEVLRKEGLIRVSQGKLREIVPGRAKPDGADRRVVGVIALQPPRLLPDLYHSLFTLDELRKHLQEAGFQLQVFSNPRLGSSRPQHILRDITREHRAACWLLVSVPRPIHEWFHGRGLPVLVFGTCYPDLPMPAIDIDNRAVCRHAAGVLLKHGHRHLAMLTRGPSAAAGDLASEDGFLEGIRKSGLPDARGLVVHHDTTKEDICRKLEAVLGSSQPPTGLLICMTAHAAAVLTHLMRKGVRIPQDISLICRDADPHLDYLSPAVACYLYSFETQADRLSRRVIELATTGVLLLKYRFMMPTFRPGETVGPPRR